MLYSIQADFMQKKLQDLAIYKRFLERSNEEGLESIDNRRIIYATHGFTTEFRPFLASNKTGHKAYITISNRQAKINRSHYQYCLKEIDSSLSDVLPYVLCQLIAEYEECMDAQIIETYKIGDEPIVGIYPINNSHSLILMGEAHDEELSAVLFDSTNNFKTIQSSYEWNTLKDGLIKQPQALLYHKQKFIDFDQSDENVAAIDDTSVVVWNKDLSYEKALSLGRVKRLKEIIGCGVGNAPCNLTTSVKFSSCGESLIVGETDGLIQIFNIATGDNAYTIKHYKNITALGVYSNGPVLIGCEDGTIDVLTYQCTHLPLDQNLSESTVASMPEPMIMEEYDPAYRPREIVNALCMYDCLNCWAHAKTMCKTCGQCCKTGISCLSSCPIFCWASSKECCSGGCNQMCYTCVTECWYFCTGCCRR